jgi:uncharacterized protein (DUF2336 family)
VSRTETNDPKIAMPECDLLLDELEASLASGNVHHRLKVLQHIADLFVAGSRRYSGAEIALFDDLLTRLAAEIETEVRARLAQRLASLPNAPPKLIRQLAFDDAIAVAAPVLSSSPQLSDADLVENAATKSQQHLYAIALRLKLSEAVTDVLVERGDRRVVRQTARNGGARFSLAGYQRLVEHASRDRRLTFTVGRRSDIPRQCFLKLLETASADVRERLEAMNPEAAAAIRDTVDQIATTMQREVRRTSRRHTGAARDARKIFRSRRLSEANVHAPAQSQQFEKTVVALSMLGLLPIDMVERALLDKGLDMVLILARAAGCSWTTTKTMLTMDVAGRGLSQQDLESAFASFERLSPETARHVIKFYERRSKLSAEAIPSVTDAAATAAPGAEAEVGEDADQDAGTPVPARGALATA